MQPMEIETHSPDGDRADTELCAEDTYMGPRQLAFFRRRLLDWRAALLDEAQQTLEQLRDASYREVGDEIDRASREASETLELRTRDRCRKLLGKIDTALARIEDGSYGWCEETGEPIGLARLLARPVATLCVEAQERREIRERQGSAGR
jgi:DnaK suppressor protein